MYERGPSPPPKSCTVPPIFGRCLLWPNGCMHQDTTWYGGSPQPGRQCVRWGPAAPPLKLHSPQFSAYVRRGQTAEWTKMPLGMEVGLGLGDFVLDGDPALPRKKSTAHQIFGPCVLWPNGWMDEDVTWYGSSPRPRPHCVRRGPSSPRERGTAVPLLFGPCLLWPRSPISATADLL